MELGPTTPPPGTADPQDLARAEYAFGWTNEDLHQRGQGVPLGGAAPVGRGWDWWYRAGARDRNAGLSQRFEALWAHYYGAAPAAKERGSMPPSFDPTKSAPYGARPPFRETPMDPALAGIRITDAEEKLLGDRDDLAIAADRKRVPADVMEIRQYELGYAMGKLAGPTAPLPAGVHRPYLIHFLNGFNDAWVDLPRRTQSTSLTVPTSKKAVGGGTLLVVGLGGLALGAAAALAARGQTRRRGAFPA